MREKEATPQAKRKDKARLLEGPVGPTLWHLSWPMTIGLFSIIAFNVIDTFYIGQLGAPQLSAMGFCFPVIFGVGAFAIGMGNGAVALIARTIGAGKMYEAKGLTTQTVMLTFLIAAFLSFIMQYASDPIFVLLGTPDHLMQYVRQYMDVWYKGLVLLIAPVVMNGLIRANGASIFPSVLMLIAALGNAILSPIMIFGMLGFPALGIAGAAWATLIARTLTFVCGFYYLAYNEKMMRFDKDVLITLPAHTFQIFKFGIPAIISQMVAPISNGIITRILSGWGPEAVAGLAVGLRIETLFIIPFFAYQAGLSPFIGQNAGAGHKHRLLEAERYTWKFAVCWGLVGTAAMTYFGKPIGSLFSDDPIIVAYTAEFLFLSSLGFIGAGLLQAGNGTLTPLGHPILGAAISILRSLGIFVPLAFLLSNSTSPTFTGPTGVFAASGIAWMITGLISAGIIYYTLRMDRPLKSAGGQKPAPLNPLPDPHPASHPKDDR